METGVQTIWKAGKVAKGAVAGSKALSGGAAAARALSAGGVAASSAGGYAAKHVGGLLETASSAAAARLSSATAGLTGHVANTAATVWGPITTGLEICGMMMDGAKSASVGSARNVVARYGARGTNGMIMTASQVANEAKGTLMRVARLSNTAGKALGGVGFATTVLDVGSDGMLTGGEAAKLIVGGIALAHPGVGLAIGGLDLKTEGVFGTSATQGLSNIIDKATGGRAINLPW